MSLLFPSDTIPVITTPSTATVDELNRTTAIGARGGWLVEGALIQVPVTASNPPTAKELLAGRTNVSQSFIWPNIDPSTVGERLSTTVARLFNSGVATITISPNNGVTIFGSAVIEPGCLAVFDVNVANDVTQLTRFATTQFGSMTGVPPLEDVLDAGFTSGSNPIVMTDEQQVQYNSRSVGLGFDAQITARGAQLGDSVAIGVQTSAALPALANVSSVAMGARCAAGAASVALGGGAISNAAGSIAVGNEVVASGVDAVVLGDNSSATAIGAIAIGGGVAVSSVDGIGIGRGATPNGAQAIVIGGNSFSGPNGVTIGFTSGGLGSDNVMVGSVGAVSGNSATAVGFDSKAGLQSVAMGYGSSAITPTKFQATAVGYNAFASDTKAVAVGSGATASGIGSIAVGDISQASGGTSVAVGGDARATADNTTAIGSQTRATFAGTTAVGVGATATVGGAQSFGSGIMNAGGASTQIGRGINNGFANSTGIDQNVVTSNSLYVRAGLAVLDTGNRLTYNAATGRITPEGSSRRIKTDEKELTDVDAVLALVPKSFYYKPEICGCLGEQPVIACKVGDCCIDYIQECEEKTDEQGNVHMAPKMMPSDGVHKCKRHGFVAEDAEAAGRPEFVTYDHLGNIVGMNDIAILALAVLKIKDLETRLKAVEGTPLL